MSYSAGLWDWYFQEEEREDGMILKNIRGFLMKRRKSPLKGYQKVSMMIPMLLLGCKYFADTLLMSVFHTRELWGSPGMQVLYFTLSFYLLHDHWDLNNRWADWNKVGMSTSGAVEEGDGCCIIKF